MLEVEQDILGAILMDSEALDKIYDTIRPEMFEHTLYQDTFREMLAMYDKGETIDYLSLAQRLQDRERTEEFIKDELYRITQATFEETFMTTKITSYADVLVKDWQSREAKNVIDHADFSPNNILNAIADVMSRFEALQEKKKTPLKSLREIVNQHKDNYFKENKGEGDVKTGIYALDELLVSFGKKSLSLIAARPSVGKTAFAIQIAKNMAKKGQKVAIFSLEMDDSEQYERLVSAESGIDLTRLQKALQYLGDEEQRFNEGNEKLSNLSIDIASGSFSVKEIYNLIKHQNYDVVIIDYLQLIEPDKSYKGNRAAEVGEISRGLKKIAMKLGIPIIALSQLNRESTQKKDKRPLISELRESGSLEQDASNIIMIWDLNDDDNCFYKGVEVAKCRQGKKGKVGMKFDGNHMTFEPRQEEFWKWEKQAKEHAKDLKPADDIADMFN